MSTRSLNLVWLRFSVPGRLYMKSLISSGQMRRSGTTSPEMGLVDESFAGNRRALARLATHIENDDALAVEAMERLYPCSGRAHTIGITGPPGAGKSTLVSRV